MTEPATHLAQVAYAAMRQRVGPKMRSRDQAWASLPGEGRITWRVVAEAVATEAATLARRSNKEPNP